MAVICSVGGYTSWSRIRLTARGKHIKDYPYATYMAHVPMVVGIDPAYLQPILANTAAFAIDTYPADDISYATNEGLNFRWSLVQQSKVFKCIARPFIPQFMTDHFLPTECGWTIEVTLNSSDFCILYLPNTEQPVPTPGHPKPQKLEGAELILLKADVAVNLVELSPPAREMIQ